MSLQNSRISTDQIDAYLEAKVKGFARSGSGNWPEKLGYLEAIVEGLLIGRETLKELREEIRKVIAQ